MVYQPSFGSGSEMANNYARNLNQLGYTFDGANRMKDQSLLERPKLSQFDEKRGSTKTQKVNPQRRNIQQYYNDRGGLPIIGPETNVTIGGKMKSHEVTSHLKKKYS